MTLNNVAALGTGTLTINGATTLTAGAALSLTTNASMNWNGLWTYNSNTLNLGTGGVTLNGENVGIITNSTNNLTVGGNISGAASLTKVGPSNGGFTNMGAIILNGNNTYTGGTVIQQGQVQFGSAVSLPTTGSVLLAPLGPNSAGYEGAAMVTNFAIGQSQLNQVSPASVGVVALGAASSNNLDFSSATGANLANISLGAQGSFTYSGTLTPWSSANNAGYYLGGSGNNSATANSTLTISSPLANAGSIPTSVTVDPAFAGFGPGSVTLSGNNSYTGQTSVATGTLTVTGTLSSSTALAVGAGGTFSYTPTVTGGTQSVNGFTANPGISFVNVTGASNTLSLSGLARNSYGVVAFNAGGLTGGIATSNSVDASGQILGAAYLYNSGANGTYAAVNGGTLSALTYAASPTATQGTLITDAGANLSGGTTNYSLNTAPATTVQSNAYANTLRYTSGAGTLTLNGVTLATNGILNAGTGVLTITSIGNNGTLVAGPTNELVLNTANNGITIATPIADNGSPSTVTISGPGTVTLSTSNGYTGGTVLNQGTLVVANSAALGSGPVGFNGGTFEYNASTGSISNSITVAAGTITNITDLQALTLTGALRGSGTLFETEPGASNHTFTLAGDDSNFTGTIVYNFETSNGDNFDFGGTQLSNDLGGVTLIGENQGSRRLAPAAGTTLQLGTLVGSVELVNACTFQVGSLNTNSTFNGISVSSFPTLTKVGTGTWTLNSQGFNITALNVNNGAVLVDLSNVPSATNFFASDPLTLNGGKLVIRGKDTTLQNSSQAFSATTINPASSSIVSDNNGGNGTLVTLAAITRNAGGAVDFTLPSGTQSSTNGITTTSTANATYGVLTSAASTSNPIAYATVNGGAGWASLSGNNIVPLSNIVTGTANYTLTNNVDVTGGDAVTGGTVNTLRFNAASIGLTLSGVNQVATGGILVTPNATNATISGGSLQTGGGNEFVFADYGSLTVSSTLVNNGNAALTKSGSGTLVLSNANNSYTGTTYLNGGITNIAADASLGSGTVAFNGGALQLASGYASTLFSNNRTLNIGYDGGTIDTNGNNVVYGGVMASSLATTGANSNFDGQFMFTKAGNGTLKLISANTYYGATMIAGGTLSVASIVTETSSGGVASGIGKSPNYARGLILNGGVLQYTGAATSTDRLFTLGDNGGGLDASGIGAINFSNSGSVAYQINSTGGPTNSSPTLTLSGSNSGGNILAASIGNNGLGTTSLVKNGTGNWTLAGVNSYSGTTTVNAGNLVIATTQTINGAVVVNGGNLVLNGGSLPGISSLTISGGALGAIGGSGNTINLPVTLAGSASPSAQGGINMALDTSGTSVLNLTGGVTVGGASGGQVSQLSFYLSPSTTAANTINLGSAAFTGNVGGAQVNLGSTALNNGTYTLMAFGSDTGLAVGSNLIVGTHPAQLFTTFSLALNANSLQVTVAGTAIPNVAYWTGLQGGVYNWGDNNGVSTTNWSTDPAGANDAGQIVGPNTDVVFSSGTATVSSLATRLEHAYTINSLTVLGSGVTATTVPVIGGSGSLTINALASATAGQNGSSVSGLGYAAGTGIVVSSGAAGLTINTTGVVTLANSQSWTNNSTGALAVTSGVNGTALTGGTQTITLGNTSSGATVLNGAIGDGSGGGKLAVLVNNAGSGITALNGPNTYSGGTTVSQGTLQAGNSSAFGAGPLTFTSGAAALDVNGENIGNVLFNPGAANMVFMNSSPTAGTVSSGFNAAGAGGFNISNFTVSGSGNIIWSGALDYTTPSNNSGVITANGSGLFDITGSYPNVGTNNGMSLTLNSGTVVLGKSGANTNLWAVTSVTINGGLLQMDPNNVLTAANIWSGQIANTVTMSGGTWDLNGTGGINNRFKRISGSGGIITNNDPNTTATLVIALRDSTDSFWSGVIQDGAGKVAVSIANGGSTGFVQTLGGTSTYSGPTNIDQNTLQAGSTTAFSPNSDYTLTNNANSILDLNDYSNSIASLSSTSTICTVHTGFVTGGTLTTGGDNATTTFAGVIDGLGGLYKTGSGTFTLSGANNYFGATTVNNGTLLITGNNSASASFAAMTAGTLNVAGQLSNGSAPVAINGGGALTGTGAIAGPVTVAGGSTAPGQGAINLVNSPVAPLTLSGGLTLGGSTAGNPSLLSFGVNPTTADSINLGSSSLVVNAGGAAITITSLGLVSGQTYTLMAFNSASGAGYTTGSGTAVGGLSLADPAVSFGVSGVLDVTGTAVELITSGAAAPNTVYWSGAKGPLWTATNGATGNFTTNLADTQFVTTYPAANTTVIFTANGATNLSSSLGQTFDINGLTFLSTVGSVNIGGGNQLTLESGGISVPNGNGGVTLGMAALVLDSSQTWTNNSTNPLNVTAALSGNGALTLAGSGTVAVAGGANIGDLTVNSGTLDLHGANSTISAVSGGANGTITTYTGSATLIVGGSDNGVYQGKLVDGGAGQALAVLENGSGILNLSGSNTYSGGTTVTSGTLQAGSSAAFGSGAVTFTTSAATLDVNGQNVANALLNSGATGMTFMNSSPTAGTISSGFNAAGAAGFVISNFTVAGSGEIVWTGAVNRNTATGGTVTVSSGGLDVTGTGTSAGMDYVVNGGTLVMGRTNNGQAVSNLIINSGLAAYDPNNVGTYGNATGWNGQIQNNLVMNGGTLDLNDASGPDGSNTRVKHIMGGAAVNGENQPGGGVVTNSGTGLATLWLAMRDNWTGVLWGGNIVDGPNGGKVGITVGNPLQQGRYTGSTMTLSGSNTYSGPTTVNESTLQAGSMTAFSPNSDYTLTNNAQSVLDLNDFSNEIGSLTGGAASIVLTGTNSGGTLTTGGDNAITTFAGVISGLGGLTLTGGTMTLSGTNTYTGGTIVSDGNLILTNGEAIVSGSSLTVGDPAELGGLFQAPSEAGVSVVPEPGTLALVAAGALTLMFYRKRRRTDY